MGTELETRRNDRIFFFDLLKAKDSGNLSELISKHKAGMEPEDVKLVLQEFEEWKKDKVE